MKLKDISEKELIPGYHVKFVHTENMSLAFWNVDAGASIPVHSHIHEQVAQVLEGKFEITVAEETKIIEPGDIVVIPGNIEHSGTAITKCKLQDTFHPVREDYK